MNRATVPDLQAMFFDQMKSSLLSITTDRSNNQGLEKMNFITGRLFYIHVYIKAINTIAIFNTIDMGNDKKQHNME